MTEVKRSTLGRKNLCKSKQIICDMVPKSKSQKLRAKKKAALARQNINTIVKDTDDKTAIDHSTNSPILKTPVAEEIIAPDDDFEYIAIDQNWLYQRSAYEEYVARGGANKEYENKLREEHLALFKQQRSAAPTRITTSAFTDDENEFFKNIIFGQMNQWKSYSWNDSLSLLRRSGWEIKNNSGSSTYKFTPPARLHKILGSHTVRIHGAHKPDDKPTPTYCVEYLKLAFKNSYGVNEMRVFARD